MTTNDSYLTNKAWLSRAVRSDTIDDIADQFERPVPAGSAAFWSECTTRRAERGTRLRSADRR